MTQQGLRTRYEAQAPGPPLRALAGWLPWAYASEAEMPVPSSSHGASCRAARVRGPGRRRRRHVRRLAPAHIRARVDRPAFHGFDSHHRRGRPGFRQATGGILRPGRARRADSRSAPGARGSRPGRPGRARGT